MTGNWLPITNMNGDEIVNFILSPGDAIATAGIMFLAAAVLIFIALCCEIHLKTPPKDEQ